jgi:hypothetical protein
MKPKRISVKNQPEEVYNKGFQDGLKYGSESVMDMLDATMPKILPGFLDMVLKMKGLKVVKSEIVSDGENHSLI